jgi:PPM family protein phosphatase
VRDIHHIVTETLGGAAAGGPKVDIERFSLLHGDVIMLCTNGLTDVADDAQSANTLRSHGKPSDQSRAPVDLAINSGARDDVTAVIAHYRIKA